MGEECSGARLVWRSDSSPGRVVTPLSPPSASTVVARTVGTFAPSSFLPPPPGARRARAPPRRCGVLSRARPRLSSTSSSRGGGCCCSHCASTAAATTTGGSARTTARARRRRGRAARTRRRGCSPRCSAGSSKQQQQQHVAFLSLLLRAGGDAPRQHVAFFLSVSDFEGGSRRPAAEDSGLRSNHKSGFESGRRQRASRLDEWGGAADSRGVKRGAPCETRAVARRAAPRVRGDAVVGVLFSRRARARGAAGRPRESESATALLRFFAARRHSHR